MQMVRPIHREGDQSSEYVLVPKRLVEGLLKSLNLEVLPKVQSLKFNPDTLLREFVDACRVEYYLCPGTIKGYRGYVRRLLDFLNKHPLQATRQELREFLNISPNPGAVKAVRIFYGRFLRSDLASSFRIPRSIPKPVLIPSRTQLQETYDNLETAEQRAMFLLLTSSGKRPLELANLTLSKIDLEKRMILPNTDKYEGHRTKFQWVSFFNDEAKKAIEEVFEQWYPLPNQQIFVTQVDTFSRKFREASKPTGFKITSKILQKWFACEMGRLGVPDRYVDAFCGRVPKNIIGQRYTDYSPENLREIYDKVNLKVLDNGDSAETIYPISAEMDSDGNGEFPISNPLVPASV